MQGIQAAKLAFDRQHSGVLHETLIDLDDAERGRFGDFGGFKLMGRND